MAIDLRTKHGWDDLKRMLDDRPHDVLDLCKIKTAPKRGKVAVIDDPRGDGKDNFAIWLKSDGLSFKNYTDDSIRGRSLELIAYCHGWYHLDKHGALEAARCAMARLGIDAGISDEALAADRARAAAAREKSQAVEDEAEARKRLAAFNLFRNAEPITGASRRNAADIYIEDARGVDLHDAPFVGPRGGDLAPHCLRFVARHKYIHRSKDGEACGVSHHPALIAACVDAEMKIAAVHQTWLRADGSDKVSLPPAPDGFAQKARKVFPSSLGCVIPLWRGDGHFSVKEAAAHGLQQTLVLTEGVEDGLSAVLAAPQHRVWAMISLSNMANVAARLPACCDAVIVHRQNDWHKPAAVEAFDRGMAALRGSGRMVAEVAAIAGKDLNDTLRGAA